MKWLRALLNKLFGKKVKAEEVGQPWPVGAQHVVVMLTGTVVLNNSGGADRFSNVSNKVQEFTFLRRGETKIYDFQFTGSNLYLPESQLSLLTKNGTIKVIRFQ